MNKVLFVALDARYSHSNPALRSIIASAREQHDQEEIPELELMESNINQQSSVLLAEIFERKAAAVFFSCYIWNMAVVEKLLPVLRLLCPDVLIGLGGPEVEYTPSESLTKYKEADLVVCGEGETVYPLLLPHFVDFAACGHGEKIRKLALLLPRLQGICLRTDGRTIQKSPPAIPADLDQIPFLYDDFASLSHRLLYYESSRGCPFCCSYCLSCRDKPMRWRSLDLVKEDLKRFHSARVPLVKWIDRSFNADRERARYIWSYLIELHRQDPCTRWHFELEAQLLGEEDFALLAQAPPGLFQFEIGIQSFNPEVLKAVNRSPETASILRALREITRHGNIHCHADLIFGLPGEDFASCARSFRLGLSAGADMLQLGFLKVLKGTPMREEAERRSYRFLPYPPYEVLSSDKLTYGEILSLKRLEAVFERFWNGTAFPHTRALILDMNQAFCDGRLSPETGFDSFLFFLNAGRYFYERGYSTRSFSQDEFFAVFYGYLQSVEKSEALQQTLRLDYEALPAGRLDSFEKLLLKYSGH